MNIFLDDTGVSKLSKKAFSKVNYSFKRCIIVMLYVQWRVPAGNLL